VHIVILEIRFPRISLYNSLSGEGVFFQGVGIIIYVFEQESQILIEMAAIVRLLILAQMMIFYFGK
jgi:hypothetical protein